MNKFLNKTVYLFFAVLICLTGVFFTVCKIVPDPDDPKLPQPPKPTPVFYYSQYGAVGDGITDDFDAIIATHEAANKAGAFVKADPGAVYYIGNADGDTSKTAVIKTDTTWTNAMFIIDDSDLKYTGDAGYNVRVWHDSWIFTIAPAVDSYLLQDPGSIAPFKKGQDKINLTLPHKAVIIATDSNTLRYRRRGENANDGTAQQDVFVVDKNGYVDQNGPVIWDFDNVTKLQVFPFDDKKLTVSGGKFITINNTGNADNQYVKRGILVSRSNTVIDSIYHDIEKEGTQGAAYTGFLYFENCANVTLKNSTLCGHKAYQRPSQSGTTRGSYDIQANRTVNLSIIDTDQLRDIKNSTWWGIFASNFSKNILFDNVKFSRFDAHMGVYNTSILNSELGHQGCSIIGSGLLLIENTSVQGTNFIYFRDDYGSAWEGELIIRDCTFFPSGSASVIHTNNDGNHDFYYNTFMPENVTIENFTVKDSTGASQGVLLFRITSPVVNAKWPLTWTKNLFISGFSSVSGKPYRIDNANFKNQLNIVEY